MGYDVENMLRVFAPVDDFGRHGTSVWWCPGARQIASALPDGYPSKRQSRRGEPHSRFADQRQWAAIGSIVIHLGKELASTLGRHVEETPERVDKIAGTMMLFRRWRRKAHL